MKKELTKYGFIQEIFSSFQGEGASLSGSCYGLRQIFVRFAGCPLALGACGTKGCVWCDSPKAQILKPKIFFVEKKAGEQEFKKVENPISVAQLVEIIENLKTPDLHSISLTGGEPLLQVDFVSNLIDELKKRGYLLYLETAYTENLSELEMVSSKIDYACVDIKDRSAQSAKDWKKLAEQELKMCRILQKNGVKVFAKVVISNKSTEEDFRYISSMCGKHQIPLVIQPVTPKKGLEIQPPAWKKIRSFTEIAGEYLSSEKIGLSVQVHKLINIL
ncbi:MAG: 7-carboxy-7-deazaguanine synthase QueE [Candidatus Heimdallarchaeum aukensis]|uniref:7-carboxy-7-deazaguanine synthase n=1 Tax=Candidatus Heimdallarchaeum aukensis TaxID=2876573 RepID=A0A9Y1BIS4_9ARCH|nr:MAG: 7-carboxy-7-deazaguanine synthase QueE [Candidatus Heimdallarchaeum aukensis]